MSAWLPFTLSTLALVLLIASASWKVRAPSRFRGVLGAQGVHSPRARRLLAVLVPAFEIAAAILLISYFLLTVVQVGTISLGVAIVILSPVVVLGAGLVVLNLALMARGGSVPCGCLDGDGRVGWRSLSRALVVLLAPLLDLASDRASLAALEVLGVGVGTLAVLSLLRSPAFPSERTR